jgi:hypothetical protein
VQTLLYTICQVQDEATIDKYDGIVKSTAAGAASKLRRTGRERQPISAIHYW